MSDNTKTFLGPDPGILNTMFCCRKDNQLLVASVVGLLQCAGMRRGRIFVVLEFQELHLPLPLRMVDMVK